MVGTTISHYKVLEKIGEGGMGEVYRAEDTNLSREVAIKVLPEQFTQDPQRLARFEREAKLLASLNHPNIAAIYGLEEAEGVPWSWSQAKPWLSVLPKDQSLLKSQEFIRWHSEPPAPSLGAAKGFSSLLQPPVVLGEGSIGQAKSCVCIARTMC